MAGTRHGVAGRTVIAIGTINTSRLRLQVPTEHRQVRADRRYVHDGHALASRHWSRFGSGRVRRIPRRRSGLINHESGPRQTEVRIAGLYPENGTMVERRRAEAEQCRRDDEQAVHGAEHDEQEHDAEHGPEEVTLGRRDGRDADERHDDALHDRSTDEEERPSDALEPRVTALEHEGARHVHREVDAEADAHNGGDARDAVDVHRPPAHESEHADDDREDADDEPEAAERLRDEDEGDHEHDHHRYAHLQQTRPSPLCSPSTNTAITAMLTFNKHDHHRCAYL